MYRRIFVRVCFLVLIVACLWADEERLREAPRVPSSGVSFGFMPAFGGTFPLHSQFSVNGWFNNLTSEGPHLHLMFGMQHAIGNFSVLPPVVSPDVALTNILQGYNMASLGIQSGLWLLSLHGQVEYVQNRLLVDAPGFETYTYDALNGIIRIAYDSRRSDFQRWYEGVAAVYPHRGWYLSAGVKQGWITFPENKTAPLGLQGEFQVLFPLAKWWTLSVSARGEGYLSAVERMYKVSVAPIGGVGLVGDYTGWVSTEVRYYSPIGGWTVYTPAFWYFAAYPVRTKMGFLAGVNAAVAGNYGQRTFSGYSVYAAPLFAVYVMEMLGLFARFDVSFGQDGRLDYRIGLSFGTVNHKPGTVHTQPISR